MSPADARPENVGRRRSLALDRGEHDGRLVAHRDGGACAAVPTLMAMLVACALIAVTAAPASAEPPPGEPLPATVSAAPRSDPWAAHIAEAARLFAIPDRWIRAVMAVESVGDPAALSPKGAIGLMQVMPATWDELRAKHGLGADPWKPRDNILAGTAYLREMHDRYGSVDAMLAAYNAGPGRYDEHLASGRALPAETVDYVAKIAPMIDGTAPITRSAGSSSLPSWRRAPLFFARSTDRDHDDSDDSLSLSGRPSDDPPIVDLSALAPPSDGLFVERPAREGDRR
ncbi:lytic transglycosylase domain-containing protein [Neoaquamicrobium sediminum]|uniref:lytic transglycosylase domain-containing protein n=1 Tax=Neoaquamicrobium sediminum TaxID=1849104 RepID=UPI001FD50C01|nr:lytic transglycosylase domain-containing protein [Mesorhizobium sediminum]